MAFPEIFAEEKAQSAVLSAIRKRRLSVAYKSIYDDKNRDKHLKKLEEIEDELIGFVDPRKLGGRRGYEDRHTSGFEKTVFFLTPHMAKNPKEHTVREFFTAYYQVKKRAEKEAYDRMKKSAKR